MTSTAITRMSTGSLSTIAPLRQALALATQASDIPALQDVRAMGAALQKGAATRGLGVTAENQAAEVVIRAERAIGAVLIELKAAGMFGKASSGKTRATTLPAVLRVFGDDEGARRTALEIRTGSGLSRDKTQRALANARVSGLLRFEQQGKATNQGTWVRTAKVYQSPRFVLRREIGLSSEESMKYQRVAAVPDEEFEGMLVSAQSGGQRLAKHNFYVAGRDPVPEAMRKAAPSGGFDDLRKGAMTLLGWTIDKKGEGHVTKNGLFMLEDSDLATLRRLVQELADAYGQVVKVRRS